VPSEWSDYRYFLSIADAGSLSAAARQLGVDQSTVGRRLAALEAQVRTRLFDRTPDGYVLTAAGESIRADVQQLEDGFLAIERRLAGGDARLEGVVRLATTEVFASALLIPHLGELRESRPGLSIELITGNRPVDLARREADLALRVGIAPRQPNLVVRQIGSGAYALYGARSYLGRRERPSVKAGLRGHDVIAYSGELARAPLGRWIAQHGGRAQLAFQANSLDAVYRAVVAGLGLGVLPCLFADRTLERVGGVLGGSPILTVVHADLVRNARIRAVLTFLTDVVEQERAALLGT